MNKTTPFLNNNVFVYIDYRIQVDQAIDRVPAEWVPLTDIKTQFLNQYGFNPETPYKDSSSQDDHTSQDLTEAAVDAYDDSDSSIDFKTHSHCACHSGANPSLYHHQSNRLCRNEELAPLADNILALFSGVLYPDARSKKPLIKLNIGMNIPTPASFDVIRSKFSKAES
jgi:hypothetical protein